MNVLDENILADQRELLQHWKVPFRQIGHEVGWSGMTDEEIIPLLLRLRRPTLFTMDAGFCDRGLAHARYGLICLDVRQSEAALFIRPSYGIHRSPRRQSAWESSCASRTAV